MSFRNLLLSVFAFAFLLSCSKDDATNPINTVGGDVLIPLKVGNYWTYKSQYFDSLGNKSQPDFIDRIQVVKDTIINNETVYKLGNYLENDSSLHDPFIAVNRSDGFYMISDDEFHTPRGFLKYPGKAGDKFFSYELGWARIVSINYTYSLPTLGTFSCYEYSIEKYDDGTGGNMQIYFSPVIGQVATELYAVTPGGKRYLRNKETLIGYYVK